jgi:hypothetical protein
MNTSQTSLALRVFVTVKRTPPPLLMLQEEYMPRKTQRREWFAQIGVLGAAGVLAGCGAKGERSAGGTNSKKGPATPRVIVPIAFSESPVFYQQLRKIVSEGKAANVVFDGNEKVTRQSALLTILLPEASESAGIWEQIDQLERTSVGQKSLEQAFASELLQTQKIGRQVMRANGEIMEPTTVVLVIVVLLVLATTAVAATNQYFLQRPVKMAFRLTAGSSSLELMIEPQ